jgi:hypothetical protein
MSVWEPVSEPTGTPQTKIVITFAYELRF